MDFSTNRSNHEKKLSLMRKDTSIQLSMNGQLSYKPAKKRHRHTTRQERLAILQTNKEKNTGITCHSAHTHDNQTFALATLSPTGDLRSSRSTKGQLASRCIYPSVAITASRVVEVPTMNSKHLALRSEQLCRSAKTRVVAAVLTLSPSESLYSQINLSLSSAYLSAAASRR